MAAYTVFVDTIGAGPVPAVGTVFPPSPAPAPGALYPAAHGAGTPENQFCLDANTAFGTAAGRTAAETACGHPAVAPAVAPAVFPNAITAGLAVGAPAVAGNVMKCRLPGRNTPAVYNALMKPAKRLTKVLREHLIVVVDAVALGLLPGVGPAGAGAGTSSCPTMCFVVHT